MEKIKKLIPLLIVFSLFTANSFAESLSGVILIQGGKPLKGTSVTVLPGGAGTVTDSDGVFLFGNLNAGHYILKVSAGNRGFEDALLKIDVPYSGKIEIILKERAFTADEVVIIRKRDSALKKDEATPSSVTFIQRSEFAEKAETVSDVIKSAPGVNVSSLGGLGDYSEISLRGAGANQVQVYLDGILLNEASGGSVNLSSIPLSNVESIEIWRSGAPEEFGGNAAGGVVSIKTNETLKNKSFSIGYGSFGTMGASFLGGVPLKSSSLIFSADYSGSENDFRFKSNNGTRYNEKDDYWATRKNDRYNSLNASGKYKKPLGLKTLVEVSDNLMSSSKNLPGQDIVQDSKADLSTFRNLFQVKLTRTSLFRDFLEIQPQFQHIYKRERYRDPDGGIGWGNQDNLYVTNSFVFKTPFIADYGKNLKIHIIPVLDRELYRPDHKLQATEPLSSDRDHLGLTAESYWVLPEERLTLNANITQDRFFSSYKGQPSPQNRITPKSRHDNLTSWHTGMKLSLLSFLSLKANLGDASRVPSFFELFGDRGYTLSKPELKPEKVRRWDAGFLLSLKPETIPIELSLESIYFRNTGKNLIQWYANDAGFLYADNVGESYVRGTEIIMSGNLDGWLNFTGNWTFQDSKVTKEARVYNENKKLPNRPDDYGSVIVECPNRFFTPYWSLNHKGQYYLDRSNQKDKLYQGRTFHDIGLIFSLREGRTKLTFTARNVTDLHTYDTLWMPLPGRSFSFKLTQSL